MIYIGNSAKGHNMWPYGIKFFRYFAEGHKMRPSAEKGLTCSKSYLEICRPID